MHKAKAALIVILLPCILPRIRHPFPTGGLVDFGPYYTAAVLARTHQGAAIYYGADAGGDPQHVFAVEQCDALSECSPQGSLFARTAQSQGIPPPLLYLYPPTLADLLIPLTFFQFSVASKLWTAINYATLPITSLLIARILRLKLLGLGFIAVLVSIFSFSPVLQGIATGQVVVLLLLLWTCGAFFYVKNWHIAAGFVLALATSIKLTPLIVVIPLLLWKEFKLLAAFVLTLLLLCVAICFVNSPDCLLDFFTHVLPAMSAGILTRTNASFSVSIERVFAMAHHQHLAVGLVNQVSMPVLLLGKVCSAAVLLAASVLVYSGSPERESASRVKTITLFAILSVCISPVSWGHGYCQCFLALCLLWEQALRQQISGRRLAILFLCTLGLTTYLTRYILAASWIGSHPLTASLGLLLLPLSGVVLLLTELWAMRYSGFSIGTQRRSPVHTPQVAETIS